MVKTFTKRSHYNPCFWTALWNEDYFRAFCSSDAPRESCREQVVHALNFRSNKIYETTVERVHFHKDWAITEIDPESMKEFCARQFPDRYEEIAEYVSTNPESLYLDFEETLRELEKKALYSPLMDIIKAGTVRSIDQKNTLICHLMIHAMRSCEFVAASVRRMTSLKMEKWEYFWLLKHLWGENDFLARAALIPALAKWTLWRTPEHSFPLCDSPVLIDTNSLMVPLSPRLLLEIEINEQGSRREWVARHDIPRHKIAEFRRRSIANTFKEVIFCNSERLEEWRESPQAKAQMAILSEQESREEHLKKAADRIFWALNGFGRLSEEFEIWLHRTMAGTIR